MTNTEPAYKWVSKSPRWGDCDMNHSLTGHKTCEEYGEVGIGGLTIHGWHRRVLAPIKVWVIKNDKGEYLDKYNEWTSYENESEVFWTEASAVSSAAYALITYKITAKPIRYTITRDEEE